MRVCATQRCSVLTDATYCERHRKQRRKQQDRRRPNRIQRGYTEKHRADRIAYLKQHPICQWHEGCLEPATDLDHIDGNPENRQWSNYRGFCHSHHSQRTAQDQPGGFRAVQEP